MGERYSIPIVCEPSKKICGWEGAKEKAGRSKLHKMINPRQNVTQTVDLRGVTKNTMTFSF